MTVKKELKKRDAISTCQQIISMDKYNVIGHETVTMVDNMEVPKGTTNILVIYLRDQ